MSRRIFVTGGNGRVGRHLVARLVELGHAVTCLVRSDAGEQLMREAGARPVRGALEDVPVVREAARGAEVVYHLAGGLRGPGRRTPDLVNHQTTLRLIEAIGEVQTLLFTSSCAVYGDRSGLWVTEDLGPSPNTRYGRSKADAEAALLDAWRKRGLPVKIVRLAAVYGPGFPFLMDDRMRTGRAWLPGEGRNYVPTIHVDDAVSGIVRVAESGNAGEIYNLADRAPVTLGEFYRQVHEYVGGTPMRFWSTWIPSYVQTWAARYNERIQSRLGLRPRFTPDNLLLFRNSVRMKVERMEKELGFEWRYPETASGLAATFAA